MGNNNSRVHNFMVQAHSYIISYDFKRAIDCLDNVLQIDPKNINALNSKGNAYYYLKEYDKAIDCINQTSQIDPKNINALNYKG